MNPAGTQPWNNVDSTLIQINVESMLFQRCVSARKVTRREYFALTYYKTKTLNREVPRNLTQKSSFSVMKTQETLTDNEQL